MLLSCPPTGRSKATGQADSIESTEWAFSGTMLASGSGRGSHRASARDRSRTGNAAHADGQEDGDYRTAVNGRSQLNTGSEAVLA